MSTYSRTEFVLQMGIRVVAFASLVTFLTRTESGTRFPDLICVEILTTPHVHRVLHHSRVGGDILPPRVVFEYRRQNTTLNPKPYTRNDNHKILNPKRSTLNPEPYTLNPKP